MKWYNYITEMTEQVKQWNDYVNNNPELKAAVQVLTKIDKAGYRAYIVGGCVRDIIIGKEDFSDIDICTNMPIEKIEKIWKVHDIGKSKDFGIVVVREGGYSFEVAQFRQDFYQEIKGVRKIIRKVDEFGLERRRKK